MNKAFWILPINQRINRFCIIMCLPKLRNGAWKSLSLDGLRKLLINLITYFLSPNTVDIFIIFYGLDYNDWTSFYCCATSLRMGFISGSTGG